MGSGASNSAPKPSIQGEGQEKCEILETKSKSKDEQDKRSRSHDKKTNEDHKRSRSRDGKTKEQHESSNSRKSKSGNDIDDYDDMIEDSVSINSKDSDDTIVVYARMKNYREGGGPDSDLDADEDDLCQDDIIDKIADENLRSYIIYDVDTIGYYIGHGSDSNHGNESVEVDEKPLTTIPEVEPNTEQKNKPDAENSDPFDNFKRIYGTNNPQKPKKKKVASKQTLVLTKIGTQYKYIAVPAYLPGQRTYQARSEFTKGYMERAAKIYSVNNPKSKDPETRKNPARKNRI